MRVTRLHESEHPSSAVSGFPSERGSIAAGHMLESAVVGGGPMARQHARAIARSSVRARVVAVVDPDTAAREAMLHDCSGATGYATLAELLSRVQPAVIHVCTPPSTHEALTEEALRGGCHVYVEKPFATSERSAARLLKIAEHNGLRVMAGHQLLFERPFRQLAQLLPTLRQIVHVESYFSFRPTRGGKLLRLDEQLLDVLPHPVYLLVETLAAAGHDGRTEVKTIEVGAGGTIHALVHCGELTATLVVTLAGRPVESYLRVVGTNGSLEADFVRGTVWEHIGPGHSGIDKVLQPYRAAGQLAGRTTVALARRLRRREIKYPGLNEAVDSFYRALHGGMDCPSPLTDRHILDTVGICEAISGRMNRARRVPSPAVTHGPRVAVTGGTGLLGAATVRELLLRGAAPLAISRRTPPPWDRVTGVQYASHDLSQSVPQEIFRGVEVVIHCAAATVGGWNEHRRHSVDATENVLRAAARAGVHRVVHVSSTAVLARPPRGKLLSEASPLVPHAASAGPYVHGKLASEQLAIRLAAELNLELRIVRPGAIVDGNAFEPPGRLGRRIGNWFLAIGRPGEPIGVVDLGFAAEVLAWMALEQESAPPLLNLIDPVLPTRRELVARLRRDNPRLKVLWLPRGPFAFALNTAGLLIRLIRPGGMPSDAWEIFGHREWDSTRIATLKERIRQRRDATASGPAGEIAG